MKVFLSLGIMLAVAALAADLETGKRLFDEKKYQDAEKVFSEMTTAEPGDVEANYYLGATLVELEKYKEAEPFLEKAAAKPEAQVALGHAYMMEQRLDDAKGVLDRVIDESAGDQRDADEVHRYTGEAHRYLGMILLKQNKFDDAYKQLSTATELDPKDAYAHYYLAMASSRVKRPDQMVKHFQMFLELAPNAPEAPKVKSLLKAL